MVDRQSFNTIEIFDKFKAHGAPHPPISILQMDIRIEFLQAR